jgi:hypothetical protein
VKPNALGARGLEDDDFCYFYVRRGAWLPDCGPKPADLRKAKFRPYLITRLKGGLTEPDQRVVFRSGDLVILFQVRG